MITVVMTSPNMPGSITFTYNESGFIASMQISETLTPVQYGFLCQNLPIHMSEIAAFKALAPKSTFIEKKMEVTFDMFWKRYNDPIRSSKKKTLISWEKMDEANQIKAYLYIPVYNRSRGTAEKKYATTYLSDALWNN